MNIIGLSGCKEGNKILDICLKADQCVIGGAAPMNLGFGNLGLQKCITDEKVYTGLRFMMR